eukprot:2379469-Pyramimonas_sp.AAC.1
MVITTTAMSWARRRRRSTFSSALRARASASRRAMAAILGHNLEMIDAESDRADRNGKGLRLPTDPSA